MPLDFTIDDFATDGELLALPYPPGPSGSGNCGFIDLRGRPDAAATIPRPRGRYH